MPKLDDTKNRRLFICKDAEEWDSDWDVGAFDKSWEWGGPKSWLVLQAHTGGRRKYWLPIYVADSFEDAWSWVDIFLSHRQNQKGT